jgi:hypothetical protein
MELHDLEQSVCIDCGEIVYLDDDQCYLVTDDDALCFECAVRRGGQYDSSIDEWVVAPGVSGLVDEQHPPL